MITRLEVDGFKSLQGFAVDLEPFTVFIGPNGAGKSNILEALALLSRLASMPIVDAFKGGRGRPGDQFSRHGDEVAREMRFAVEFLFFGTCEPNGECKPNGESRFRYELVIERVKRESGTEHLSVRHELLRTLQRDEDAWIDARPDFAAFVTPHEKLRYYFVAELGSVTKLPDGSAKIHRLDPRRTRLAHDEIPRGVDNFVPSNFVLCQWLRLDLDHLAGPSDRVDTGGLRPDGSNLPTVLADLAPELLGEIRADLVALVPGLSSFFVVPEGDALRIEFELSGGERLPAHLASDGTLRLLALLTTLRMEPRPYLIGIEEPENGIFPGRLLALVDVLRQEATRRLHEEPGWVAALLEPHEFSVESGLWTNLLPTQILLTTHSPLILAALRKHAQQLRFIDVVHRDRRRVTRARTVGRSSSDQRHLTVSLREIDQLLNTVTGGDFT
jgi:energy-coupling factor transporter ATP-binding protein EcfA2